MVQLAGYARIRIRGSADSRSSQCFFQLLQSGGPPLVFSVLDAVGSTLDGDVGSRRPVRERAPRRCSSRSRLRFHVIGRIVLSSSRWCSAECASNLRGARRRRQGLQRSRTTSALTGVRESSARAGGGSTCCLVRVLAALLASTGLACNCCRSAAMVARTACKRFAECTGPNVSCERAWRCVRRVHVLAGNMCGA